MEIDFKKENNSYFLGFFYCDGHFYEELNKDKGKISFEISEKDEHILYEFQKFIPANSYISKRTRNTNFKNNFTSTTLNIHDKRFRDVFKEIGIVPGKKSINFSLPKIELNKNAFFRGMVDGDGSIGFTKDNEPFINLTTQNENIKKEFINLIFYLTKFKKNINRNKRDNIYNITVKNEDAIILSNYLYENSTIYLKRKYLKYLEFKKWKRTKEKRIVSPRWSEYEIDYILTHNIEDCKKNLNRTEKAIKLKLYRLKIANMLKENGESDL